MLGAVDHVGYLAADLDGCVAQFCELFELPIARRIERPQFSLVGVYLGEGPGSVEIFNFTDAQLTARRLDGAAVLLDHVAYEVADIEAASARMRLAGVRFCGPDLREELDGPVELGGVLHLWTVPDTSAGQMLQLMQR